MKITKQYLRNLITESLQEMENNPYASQMDLENPELAQLKDKARLLDDELSRLLLKIKELDPQWSLESQRDI
jgi:hypothetical protein